MTRVIPEAAGKCITREETASFRVPYVEINRKANGPLDEINFGTVIRNDIKDLEPGACRA